MLPCFNSRDTTLLILFSQRTPTSFLFCSVTTQIRLVSQSSCLSYPNAKHSCILHIVRALAELVSFYFSNIFTNSTTTNVISINEKQYSVLCKTPEGPVMGTCHLSTSGRQDGRLQGQRELPGLRECSKQHSQGRCVDQCRTLTQHEHGLGPQIYACTQRHIHTDTLLLKLPN